MYLMLIEYFSCITDRCRWR